MSWTQRDDESDPATLRAERDAWWRLWRIAKDWAHEEHHRAEWEAEMKDHLASELREAEEEIDREEHKVRELTERAERAEAFVRSLNSATASELTTRAERAEADLEAVSRSADYWNERYVQEHKRAEDWRANALMHVATLDRVRELRDRWAFANRNVPGDKTLAAAVVLLTEALEGGEDV